MNQTPDELLFLQEVVVCHSEVIIFNYLQNVLFFACVFLLLLFHIYDSFVNLFDQCVCVLNFYFLIPLRCYISSISLHILLRLL